MHQESLASIYSRVATWPEKAKVPAPHLAADAQLINPQAESNLLLFSKVGLLLGQAHDGKSNALPPH